LNVKINVQLLICIIYFAQKVETIKSYNNNINIYKMTKQL